MKRFAALDSVRPLFSSLGTYLCLGKNNKHASVCMHQKLILTFSLDTCSEFQTCNQMEQMKNLGSFSPSEEKEYLFTLG